MIIRRVLLSLSAIAAASAVGLPAFAPSPARAAAGQVSIVEDDAGMLNDPQGTLKKLEQLGAQEIRMPLRWSVAAPRASSYHRPSGFNASDPAARGYDFAPYDSIVTDAARDGITVDFDLVGGAPLWATGRGAPGHSNWEPNASEFAQFVKAVGIRYSGNFDPLTGKLAPRNTDDLPRVSFWSVWNEPDYGPSLAPQGIPGHLTVDYAPLLYRRLVDAAWSSLQRTGHARDTVLFGELAPRGMNYWGVYSGMRPLVFLRSLYCVDSRYRPLRGTAAREHGCPTNAAGTRSFPSAHPALFRSSGVADHPYMRWYAPNHEVSPDPVTHQSTTDYATLGDIGQLERGLDRMQRVYGSHRRLDIYDTEFGYLTSPPKHPNQLERGHRRYPWVSQATGAYYLNWAEYIHWRDPRIKSFMQYLLKDPLPALPSNDWGGFASGLVAYNGIPKATYYAWRMPVYLPTTVARRGSALSVWGCVRPAFYALGDGLGVQTAQIQSAPGSHPSNGAFKTVASVRITSPRSCYFNTRVRFPGTGVQSVRVLWSYPASDPMGYFDPLSTGKPIYSRHVLIRLR